MYDDRDPRHDAGLTAHQRAALCQAQLQVLPDDWSRTRVTWLDFGRMLRGDSSPAYGTGHGAAA